MQGSNFDENNRKARITHEDSSLSFLVTPAHEKFSDSGVGHFLRLDFEGMKKATGALPSLYRE